MIKKLGSNLSDLMGSLTSSEDDFGKALTQRAMRIDSRESDVSTGRGLKCFENFVARHATGAKFLQQLSCFDNGHGRMIFTLQTRSRQICGRVALALCANS